jgi:hypothetical protein
MTAKIARLPSRPPQEPSSAPIFEVRITRYGPGDSEVEVWQLPSPASPQLSAPRRLAGLRGRNLDLVEHRVLKLLAAAGVRFAPLAASREAKPLGEEAALRLGLLFRTLAPMRSREAMRTVAEGIESMGREEAAYWLGMAIHRRNPRRVLTALRFLLTEPRPVKG